MQTTRLSEDFHELAPDGSQVRFLLRVKRGELNHFTLPARSTSSAMVHRTIEEIWYFLSGEGQFWRKEGDDEQVVNVGPGVSLDIPAGVHFQFRNTGNEPMCFVIATMPPWPGDGEAVGVSGPWEATD